MYGPSFTSSSHCLTFWYQFETQDIILFRAMANDTEEIIFSAVGGTGIEWRFGAGQINGAKTGRVMFEAYSGETRYGYIAIDDILLDDSLNCPVKGKCDFEDGVCGWTNTGDLEWVFGKLEGEMGPLTPTHLMFVTPRAGMEGKQAILTSPILEPDANCVKFWYKREKEAPASFVGAVAPGPESPGAHTPTAMWQLPSTVGEGWEQGQFPIMPEAVDSLQVNMVATRLAGSWTEGHTHGLVSMDELEVLITAECHLVPPDAVPVTTPAPPSTIRPTVSPTTASCDFGDQTFCEWRSQPGDVTWSLLNGIVQTHSLGPLSDHTALDGYFMTLTPTIGDLKGEATLISPELSPTEDLCMRFW
ncbi:MAM and LDL-receptor class A domain-containing protein 2-like, partial [Penaeus monodon]|uniref:MAM and LDL-receptor class A domain-containing protein 2-like n=1 Tax=Penaeus monodon TaxID=6687 RepID=UPI0018A7068D